MAKKKLSPVAIVLLLAAAFGVLGLLLAMFMGGSSSRSSAAPSVPTISPLAVWEGITSRAGSAWDSYTTALGDFWGGVYDAVTSPSSSGDGSSSALPEGVESDPVDDPYGESRETS